MEKFSQDLIVKFVFKELSSSEMEAIKSKASVNRKLAIEIEELEGLTYIHDSYQDYKKSIQESGVRLMDRLEAHIQSGANESSISKTAIKKASVISLFNKRGWYAAASILIAFFAYTQLVIYPKDIGNIVEFEINGKVLGDKKNTQTLIIDNYKILGIKGDSLFKKQLYKEAIETYEEAQKSYFDENNEEHIQLYWNLTIAHIADNNIPIAKSRLNYLKKIERYTQDVTLIESLLDDPRFQYNILK